jgi:hypothetical protein
VTNVSLDESEMKNGLISKNLVAFQITKNVIIFTTWDKVHKPLDTT